MEVVHIIYASFALQFKQQKACFIHNSDTSDLFPNVTDDINWSTRSHLRGQTTVQNCIFDHVNVLSDYKKRDSKKT